MGIADRDYMRETRLKRGGLFGRTRWNAQKGRRELDDETPLGSASWIGGDLKFDDYDRVAKAYKKSGRKRARKATRQVLTERPERIGPPRWLIPSLCLLAAGIPILADMKRGGWIPDSAQGAVPFPESGSVAVAQALRLQTVRSNLIVQTADANAVVQLFDPRTDEHALSVFVAANDRVEVPAPVGTWRMRVIEGQRWYGPSRFFGRNTSYETVAKPMRFTRGEGNGIDLRRSADGNLPTRAMLGEPEPL